MRKRTKKAAFAAAFGYLCIIGFGLGMLKAAQQTRRTLYGGAPVMAQITHETQTETAISLGGGEWTLTVTPPETDAAIAAAETMPPSMAKLLLRLAILADQAANYTAELITGA